MRGIRAADTGAAAVALAAAVWCMLAAQGAVSNGQLAAAGVLLTALPLWTTVRVRQHLPLLVVAGLLLYFHYSVAAAVYWKPDAVPAIFARYSRAELLSGAGVVLLFWAALTAVLPGAHRPDLAVFSQKSAGNPLLSAPCAAYIALAPVLFYRSSAFGVRGSGSTLYEYAVIVLVVGLSVCGRRPGQLALLGAASGLYCLHSLVYGERITVMQAAIVWGLYLLLHRLTVRTMLAAAAAGLVLLTLAGMFRGAASWQPGALREALHALADRRLANDTAYFAYQSGLSIRRLEAVWGWAGRLGQLGSYLLYLVFGSAVPNSNLSVLAAENSHNWGGGWLPFYGHFWLGAPGTVLLALGAAALLRRGCRLDSAHPVRCYLGLYLVASCPRWYLYSPSQLVRGAVLVAVGVAAAGWLDARLKRSFPRTVP